MGEFASQDPDLRPKRDLERTELRSWKENIEKRTHLVLNRMNKDKSIPSYTVVEFPHFKNRGNQKSH